MRRALMAAALGCAVAAVLVLGLGAANGPSGYRVTAIFDNAGYAAPGEQVRIAGAPVGAIAGEWVTRGHQAAVTLRITDASFTPWHADATCAIRPQSLIAERYVDCSPGSPGAPPLTGIGTGPGRGTHLLAVTRTSSPIDPDVVQSIATQPVAESLSVILDQLGTGLAARGGDLAAVIRRSVPGLDGTRRVFSILAGQAADLAALARDGRRALVPLAAARQELTGFVTHAATTAAAAADAAPQIAASIHALPPFLRALRPLMDDLGALARQGRPDLSALGRSAASLQASFGGLVPFAGRTRTALVALAAAARRSEADLIASVPLAHRLGGLGGALSAPAATLDRLTASLSRTGAIPSLLTLLFNGAGATNGFDADGHYLRTDLQVGSCTGYARAPVPGCSANLAGSATAAGRAVSTPPAAVTAIADPARRLDGLLGYLLRSGR